MIKMKFKKNNNFLTLEMLNNKMIVKYIKNLIFRSYK